MEISLILAMLLARFDFTVPAGETLPADTDFLNTIVLPMRHGIRLTPVLRTDDP